MVAWKTFRPDITNICRFYIFHLELFHLVQVSVKRLIMPVMATYWVPYCSRTSTLEMFCLFSSSLQWHTFSYTWVSKSSIDTCWYRYFKYVSALIPISYWYQYSPNRSMLLIDCITEWQCLLPKHKNLDIKYKYVNVYSLTVTVVASHFSNKGSYGIMQQEQHLMRNESVCCIIYRHTMAYLFRGHQSHRHQLLLVALVSFVVVVVVLLTVEYSQS